MRQNSHIWLIYVARTLCLVDPGHGQARRGSLTRPRLPDPPTHLHDPQPSVVLHCHCRRCLAYSSGGVSLSGARGRWSHNPAYSLRRQAADFRVLGEAGVPDTSRHSCVGPNDRGFKLFIVKEVRGGCCKFSKVRCERRLRA